MTQAIQNAAQSAPPGTPIVNPGANAMGRDDFLKLLVAQLGHQDPTNPMDNTAFVAQLAQFSQLEQLAQVNSGIEALHTTEAAAAGTAVVGLIGKTVTARKDSVELASTGASASIGFDLQGKAETVEITIRDKDGKTVRTLTVDGARPAGSTEVEWDGKDDHGQSAPAGSYRVEVRAKDAAGNPVGVAPRMKGRVDGVTFANGGPELLIGKTKISLGDVIDVAGE